MKPLPTGIKPSGHLNVNINCILFDIYGTLFISNSGDLGILQKKAHKQGPLQSLLHEFSLEITPETLLENYFNTIEEAHASARSSGIDFPEVNILTIWGTVLSNFAKLTTDELEHFAIQFELMVNPVYPMPGLKECLKHCHEKGMLMGIVSNAQFYTPLLFDWFLDESIQQLGFDMELVLFSYQYGIAKPGIQLFEIAAKKLESKGISREDTVFIGNDMLKDLFPAGRVGFKTALFAGDSRSLRLREDDPRCQFLKPDLILTELSQILKW